MKPYFNESFDYINSFYPISKSVHEKLYDANKFREIKANTKLLNIGVVPQKIYLILKGVVRSYMILADGREVTKSLFDPMIFFASFKSLLSKAPSDTIYESLTDCHILEIDYDVFMDFCKTYPDVLTFYSKFLEYLLLEKDKRFLEISTSHASERYLNLRARIPNLDNIIPQYQIASCLGITPVQLSRIRSKLINSKN